jgi:dephospho-CoA kinase
MNFKYAIALTGGIATGKSTVVTMLKKNGFEIIDADKISHQILDLHYEGIANLFGNTYIKDKKVNRKELGKLIFGDKTQRVKLEEFLHPLIQNEIQKQANILKAKQKPYIIDIPLFFEKRSYDIDKVVTVYCTKEQQLQRLMMRDDIDKKSAKKRIDSQMSINKKKKLASFVIDNTKNLEHLQNEVDRFILLM